MRSFDEMNRLFGEMDRTFDQLRATWWDAPGTSGAFPALESTTGTSTDQTTDTEMTGVTNQAAVSLEDDGEEYCFVMDLPGFDRGDIDLTYEDGHLSIRAHADIEEGSDAYRSIRSRHVSRQVPVPKAVVVEEITATYRNGVLEVRLPIVEEAREETGHRIDVE